MTQPTTQHTPGPWKVNGYGYRKNDASPTGREVYICGPDSGLAEGFTVNAANVEVCRMDRHTRGADARLIAASPDLLEACRTLVQLIDVQDHDVATVTIKVSDLVPFVRTARAAIAKAEGRGEN